jgi:hypothetical protein
MALGKNYLDYPKRRHGMDHDLYPWSNMFERRPIDWGEGRQLAVLIATALEYFPMEPNEGPFRAPGHMVTPYPDLRHYTAREYGTRVGFFRFLKIFERLGIKASIPMNAAIAERYPSIVEEVMNGGHEIIGHSLTMNDIQFGGMDRQAEADLIGQSIAVLERVSGQKIRGWRSIAGSESEHTLSLLVDAGIDFVCDWVNDDLPYTITTEQGSITSLPLNHELSDRQIIAVCQNSEEQLVEQISDQTDLLVAEAQKYGGRMFAFSLTPYIMGLPYRIKALQQALSYVIGQDGAWSARASDIVDAWSVGQTSETQQPK